MQLIRAQSRPSSLEEAYKLLAKKDYDAAIASFRGAIAEDDKNAAVHKDFAYTLLKTGDSAEARDAFERAMQLDARDETAALEFAFLAFETGKPRDARRKFDKLRHSANPSTRTTAEQAFQRIDEPLARAIVRWREALAQFPDTLTPASYSAHWELAQTAELRDELTLAAEQYAICRRIKPQLSELLIKLANVWGDLGRVRDSRAAYLAASRSKHSRTAERGLEAIDRRYPYPYEFVDAINLDPNNTALRKELAYLYLAMHSEPEAIAQFARVVEMDPKDSQARMQLDLLRGIKTRPPADAIAAVSTARVDPKSMGEKSLALGYLHDAVKYLEIAHEENPDDADVMLKLGWAYNQSKDDGEAIAWFDRARRADDVAIAGEASRAFHNLRGDTLPQTTIWALPMFSSRWKDVFSYGQIKRTLPIPRVGKVVSAYVSLRFAGDLRSGVFPARGGFPQYLSETGFVVGAGVASHTWHHLTAWAEAGEGIRYLTKRTDVGAAVPDYRGGLNFAKGFGALLSGADTGPFFDSNLDAVYISRFDKDWLFPLQARSGRTFLFGKDARGQLLFNVNYTRDLKKEDWANTLEVGPGVRFRWSWMPANMYVSTDLLHGFYTVPTQRRNYNDVRAGLWYAVTR